MNLELLTKICNEINSCPDWKNGSLECGRDETAIPKTVEIRDTQKILLITRDPSNQANKLDDVTGFENSFFRDKVLPILFADYKAEKAKKDRAYFEDFREKFLSLFYWTHYQKCFPGVNSNGHKVPEDICAGKYLRAEMEAFEPELIICMGSPAIKFITGEKKLLDAISKNGKNATIVAEKMVPVISLTHPSNANNKAKNNPLYKYEETKKLIHENIESYLETTYEIRETKDLQKGIETEIEEEKPENQLEEIYEETEDYGGLISPPALKKSTMDQLELQDPFFNTLRNEYPEFEDWFRKKAAEKRECLVHYRDNGQIGALLIYKEEEDKINSIPPLPPKKRLKLSTFKVDYLGNKIGELFIKLAIEYAIRNDINEIYLTHFEKDNDPLLKLITKYGFYQAATLKEREEPVFIKKNQAKEDETGNLTPLEISSRYYPSFKDGTEVNKFIIPIIPDYHHRLFTDYKSRQTTISEHSHEFVVEGNTISKAYLSHSKIKKIKPGDLLLFYRSKSKKSRSKDQGEITSLGVVEEIYLDIKDIEEIEKLTRSRTVYTLQEIKDKVEKQTMLILFRWHFHLPNPLKLNDLINMEILKAPPQSITQIVHKKYLLVKDKGGINEHFTLN